MIGLLVFSVIFSFSFSWAATVRFMTSETDPPSVKAYEEIIAKFEKQNPGIEVSLELQSADRRTKLLAAVAAKSPPEVAQVMIEEITSYAKAGELAVLDEIVDTIGKEDFSAGSLQDVDGHVYAIPYGGAASVLWVRTDLFEKKGLKYPTNWEEWLAAAKELTMDTNGDGRIDIYGLAMPGGKNKWTGHNINMLTLMAGGSLFDKGLNVTYDSPEAVEALKFYAKLVKYAPPGFASYSFYETIDAFAAGRVAMSLYMGRLLAHVATKAPHLEKHTKAVPMPRGKYKATHGTWDQYAVFSGSKNPEEGKKFLAFLTQPENMLIFAHTVPGHIVPPLKSILKLPELYENPLIKKHPEDIKILFGAGDYGLDGGSEAGASPDKEGVVRKSGVFNPYMSDIYTANVREMVAQKHVLQNVPAEEAVKWGAEEMKRIVEERKKR
jgi:ABC-type glycerol-3-phosphate transport system substrate-binding protein